MDRRQRVADMSVEEMADELRARLECARTNLRHRSIRVQLANGTTLRIRGADFSYGIGRTSEEAETCLRSHKTERETRGEVARGQLCGITVSAELLPVDLLMETAIPVRLPR